MGIIFTLGAVICWGAGDFLIQRSVRRMGNLLVLFYITIFGAVLILPFVYRDILALAVDWRAIVLLLAISVVIFMAAILDFEALRVGKIAVVEPIYAFELLVTAVLASLVLNERLDGLEVGAIVLLMIGIFLVSLSSWQTLQKIHFEKGVFLALAATGLMGAVNFLFGLGARETSPLLVNWFMNFFIATALLVYFSFNGRWRGIVSEWQREKGLVVAVSLFDNFAWVFFAYSMLYMPIAIATGISESYIILAVALGMIVNKEKIKNHQWVGIALVAIMATALAILSEK